MTTTSPGRISVGSRIPRRQLESIKGCSVDIGVRGTLTHLQFRRFAGCPVCNLHLHSFAQRHQELLAAGITEVAVFHSRTQDLLSHAGDLPFFIIADPQKRLYAEFGVEAAPRALFDRRAWRPIARAVLHSLRERRPMPSLNPEGGRFGLPADFLIGQDGLVLACKYGEHVDDHWSVDEVLALARGGKLKAYSLLLPVPGVASEYPEPQ